MDLPVADIASDPALATRLVRQQHPDLADRPVRLIASGWDNAIYRLGDDLCVRLPRRQVAVQLLRNEQRWLPSIAGRVSVRVPVPVRIGAPTEEYPWPWTINPWFEGRPATDLSPARRAPIAAELAEFMAAMHVPAPAEAPHNPVRGVPLDARTPAVHERLASGLVPRAGELRELWDRLVAVPPWAGPPLWLHGDPHPANILLSPGEPAGDVRLAAVLDFGDLTAGDPATDLAAAWLIFDAVGRHAFRTRLDRRGGVDARTWDRARGWALNIGSALAVNSVDSPHLSGAGWHALAQVLLDS